MRFVKLVGEGTHAGGGVRAGKTQRQQEGGVGERRQDNNGEHEVGQGTRERGMEGGEFPTATGA